MTAPAQATLLPWMPGAVRAWLAADAGFMALVPGGLVPRSPGDATRPWATYRAPGNIELDAGAGAWSLLAQVDGWCPAAGYTYPAGQWQDPAIVAWNIAAKAAARLVTAKNVPYLTAHWSIPRVTDGPLEDIDTTRGESVPIYRATVRALMLVHNP